MEMKCENRHAWPKWPECHNLASYQTKMAHFPPNFLRKSQKSPIFDQKCSHLVTLRSGSTENSVSTRVTRFIHFPSKNWRFWHFLKKICQISTKTSGNQPNCDILAIWQKHVWFALTLALLINQAYSKLLLVSLKVFRLLSYRRLKSQLNFLLKLFSKHSLLSMPIPVSANPTGWVSVFMA